MPEPGLMLCFESVWQAKMYRRMLIADFDWKPRIVTSEDYRKHSGVTLWQYSEPTMLTSIGQVRFSVDSVEPG
jgi:hypothetical protein